MTDNTECKIDMDMKPSEKGDGMKIRMRMKGKGCKNLSKDDLMMNINK